MSNYHTCTKVSLLKRPISNGRISLYLDFYPAIRNPETMQMTRREYLGIYIFAKPRNDFERDFNNQMMEKAEAIRCLRVTSLINEQFGFLDHTKMQGDFLAYFKKMCKNKDSKWDVVYKHFATFVQGHCTFKDVTIELCKKFREYLLDANNLRLGHLKLSQNSAAGYYSTFRGLLKIAYRDKYLRENINDYLDKIETKEVKREYLTFEELKVLAATPCKFDVLKRASLFSCLTGLRISDIMALEWEHIQMAPDGGMCISKIIKKTDSDSKNLPISDEALNICGERSTGLIFKGLKRSMTNIPLKEWIAEAGIKKNISFHCFRHTYATLQIASGTDIYTVSKMLVHKNVSTTQIYADMVSSKKRETVDKISLK